MELLAPAGGPEQLRAAVHFGADAVYLATSRWGMRARAENFSEAQLADAVAYAHEHSVAVHVTINTLMSDEDTDALPVLFAQLDELRVDAIIAADLGALELARLYAPHVVLHLSTQASVMNAVAADAYARMGVRRIVLAREMTLVQIAELRRRCSRELELEVFAHGSMCMAYSGRCLLSAELMGPARSASKGACAQPCRWGWSLVEDRMPDRPVAVETDGRGSYLLSSNDLCMIEHLDALVEAGVDAIKLEGRAKGTYYTAVVTNAYRHVLDGAPIETWRSELDAVSHRPYSTGFFFGGAESATGPTQNPGRVDYARERLMVGVVEKCERVICPAPDGGAWLAEVRCRNKAVAGDEVTILSPGEPPRRFALEADLTRTMELYQLRVPFPLAPLDLLCL